MAGITGMAINLLPKEYRLKSPFSKARDLLRKATLFLSIVLVVGLSGLIVTLLLLEREKRFLEEKKRNLTDEVRKLESVEQKYVLVKDRLEEAQEILAIADFSETSPHLTRVLDYFPREFLEISGISFVPAAKLELSFRGASAVGFKDFFEALVGDSQFKNVSIKSWGYTPGGYEITLLLIPKI